MQKILENSSNQSKILYLFLFMVVGAFFASSVMFFLSVFSPQLQPDQVWYYRLTILLQNFFMFFLPAYAIGAWSNDYSLSWLGLKKSDRFWRGLIFTVLIYLFSIPMISVLEQWNKQIVLPESLHAIERLMREMEDAALETLNLLFKDKSTSNLLINILLIAAITALVEELFFRGALQQFFEKWFRNAHAAVWMTAFIFSAIHFQFYGFAPRLFLGALLGYLFVYTRNLWYPIIFHFVNNAMVVIAVHYGMEGNFLDELVNMPFNPLSWIVAILSGLLTLYLFRQYKKE